ncbi:MAG: hypothetical protein RBT57_10580 [Paludibacter sp.]|jgi:hypothetical protein|nr:hypothetical protein [Paludibacter sp.]
MKKLTILLLTTFFVFLSSRCTFTDDIEKLTNLATDSLSLILGTPVFDTGLQLSLKNAKTNDYIEDEEVTVTVTGKDAGIVYNNLGIKSSAYKTKLGIIHLILDPTKTDSASMLTTPKEFDLQITAPGYTSVTQRVQFDRKTTRLVTVSLVKLDDAPEGVAVASSPGFANSSASGSTTNTGTLDLNGGDQQLKLEPGVVLLDATGGAVTGSVTANVLYYDPTADNASSVFPGGIDASVKFEDNKEDIVRFEPVGLFNIKLTAGGKSVKTFSNGGLTLKTEIAEGTINPSTNQPYKENDQVGMWSREEGSGGWSFEKNATVKMVNGQLILEETVTHLSDHLFSSYRDYCTQRININFTGKVSSNDLKKWSPDDFVAKADYFEVTPDGKEVPYDYNWIYIDDDGTISAYKTSTYLRKFGSGIKLKIIPSPQNFRKLNFSQTVFNLPDNCDDVTFNITVTETSAPNNMLDINFDLAVSSGPVVVKPNMEIKYRKTGSGSSYNSTKLVNGKGKMAIELSTDYDILVTLGANQGKGKIKVEAISPTRFRITLSALSLGNQTNSAPMVIDTEKAADGSLTVIYKVEVDAAVLNQLM